MAKFNIISKDGESVRFSGCPKYTGTFLGVSFLEFSNIDSPTLIEWEIGDYIDYHRTGLRYKLYSLPIPKKQARSGAYGASFVYPNVKFYAETKDLEIAPFRDIVPEDNKIHFSTRPEVSTYENVYGLARRIQACMDDVFPGKWRIEVYDTDDTKLIETLNETKDFSISNSNCLQTLSQIYEKWDNIGWIHSYDSAQNVHVITIGRASVRDNENTSDVFAYGLGNGLTSIKKVSTNEDEFATRLYVYGSDRNIQTRYYKDFNILNAESVDIRNLMLPISTWGKTDGLPDARKAYLEADESVIAKYGLIPRTVYFDGSQNEAIYPSIQGLKMSQVREEMIAAGHEDSKHLPPNENIRIDKTGYIIISLNSMIFDLGDGSKADVESNPTFLLSLPAVGFDIAEQGTLTSEGLATISMKSGPCAGREFKVKSYWGYTNQLPNGYHAYEVYRNWDESLRLGFPNKAYKINEGDEYVLLDIPMPDYYITLAEKRLLEAGQKKLAECTKISPYYEPAIDSIIIKESGKTLREGMYMQISDTDIIDTEDGKDYVLIDTLTIDEKAELPKYNITLRKQKRLSKSFASLESRIGASEKSLSTLTTDKAGKSDIYNQLRKYVLLEAPSQTIKGDFIIDGNLVIKGDAFSYGQFAAATVGAEGGGSVGATYLSDLYDVSLGSLLSGDILSWNGSEWVNIKQSSLVPDLSAYASKSFVSDVLEGYLPKSGGEISGVSATPLIIKASNTSEIGVAYSMNDATKGWIGYNPTYGTTLYNYASNAYLGIRDNGKAYVNDSEIYHTGNFNPADYLPLSGGTMSGKLNINTSTPEVICSVDNNDMAIVGYRSGYGAWLYNDVCGSYLNILDSGTPTFNGNTLIHSGNIGSQSVASATKLETPRTIWGQSFDGTGNVSGTMRYVSTIHFATYDNGFYGIYQGNWYAEGLSNRDLALHFDKVHFSGNVLVGTTTDSGHKLQVNGTVNLFGHAIDDVSEVRCYDSGTGYFVGKRNNGLGATDGGLLLFSYGATPMSFYTNSAERMHINASGNVTIGDSDYAASSNRFFVHGGAISGDTWADAGQAILVSSNAYYLALTTNESGYSELQSGQRNVGAKPLVLQKKGGNVLIGTTYDYGSKLCVEGGVQATATAVPSFTLRVRGEDNYHFAQLQALLHDDVFGTIHFFPSTDLITSRPTQFNNTINLNAQAVSLGTWQNPAMVVYAETGNVIIGATTDRGHRLTVGRPDGAANLTSTTLNNSLLFVGMSESVYSYGTNFWTEGSGNGFIQQGRTDDEQPAFYDLILQPFGRNVGIGTSNPQHALDVVGEARATSLRLNNSSFAGLFQNSAITTGGNSTDIWLQNSDGKVLIYGNSEIGLTAYVKAYSNMDVVGSLVVQSGITTNEITIGGIKLDVVNGALRVNGDIFSTGQFAASVAGEATGSSNIVLDYASIVNALGYTPANNNNLAQVAFTGSYTDLSNKPTSLPASDVYSWAKASVKPTYSWSEIQSKPDVYTKQEVDDKLSDIGGGEGCNCDDSTSGLGDSMSLSDLNGVSYDVPNGVNCVMVYESATLDFSSVIPLVPSRPCIMYLVKTDDYTLQVTYSSNITSANSSGGLSEQFSVDGYTGMMLVWDTDYWKWHAYIQKM